MGNNLAMNDIAVDIKVIRLQNDRLEKDMASLRAQNEQLRDEVKSLKGRLREQSDEVWTLHKKLGEVERKYKQVLEDKENLLKILKSGGRLDEVGVAEIAEQQAILESQFEEIKAVISETKSELDVSGHQRGKRTSGSPSSRSRVYEKEDEDEEPPVYGARSSVSPSPSEVETRLMDSEAEVRLRWRDYSKNAPSGKMDRLRRLAKIITELLSVLASAQEKLGKGSSLCKRLQKLREEIEDEGRRVSTA